MTPSQRNLQLNGVVECGENNRIQGLAGTTEVIEVSKLDELEQIH